MKQLSLLRHATASPEGADDHSRPLSPQGMREAVDIALHWQLGGIAAPSLILSSDALRTRETAQAVAHIFSAAMLTFDNTLYLATPDAILDAVMTVDDRHDHIAIVGHNPGMGQLAFDLGGHAHPLIARGFAPATLATFDCVIDAWPDLRPQHITLKNVIAP